MCFCGFYFRVLIGAPLSSDNNKKNGEKWGTVYECKTTNTDKSCTILKRLDTIGKVLDRFIFEQTYIAV